MIKQFTTLTNQVVRSKSYSLPSQRTLNHTFHYNYYHYPYSTTTTTTKRPIIPLAFEKFQSESSSSPSSSSSSKLPPIIILHGLFGSKQNWRTLAKKISSLSDRAVFTLDLRNHGESDSVPHFNSYIDYALDVRHFLQNQNLNQVVLMGHSMGGKVAMTVALETCNHQDKDKQDEDLINKLIVVDISPARGRLSESFLIYLDAFTEINSKIVSNRKEADQILSQFEQDEGVRQFLLTNLKRIEEEGKEEYKIRLPIEVLKDQLEENRVGDFPYDPKDESVVPFKKPTLFIKGSKSKYINNRNSSAINTFFINSNLVSLDTGHWVHAEKPNEFINLVVDFIKEKQD